MAKPSLQLNLPPAELRSSEQDPPLFRIPEQEPLRGETSTPDTAHRVAAELFDEACTAAKLRNKEIAHLLDVGESLVQKWRSPESRGCPSQVQTLLLPASYHVEYYRALDRRFGWFGQAALRRALQGFSELAWVVAR